ncbi:uncharacterized protein LOC128733137 isoform X2 [Sabethes cyaneus]|uniref:uncharacterized protein LOC128733137 isoform X2 n=1 Tax=Sabethes cyaneus TaxID=53552 RepID=UPI00237DDF78|nr:uncharacterized protein LOC128733137 isoform X2 [Sabethes cyaneus]
MSSFTVLFITIFTTHMTIITTQNISVLPNISNVLKTKLSRNSHGRSIEQFGALVSYNRSSYKGYKTDKKTANKVLISDTRSTNVLNNSYVDAVISLFSSGSGGEDKKEISSDVKQNVPRRPGVISYKHNSDVPIDNAMNYGGLNGEDIWLSEDHLLIIKGGNINKNNKSVYWKPIDDYEAPARPIKLPLNPKIPPPFPVQLFDGGPIKLIKNIQLQMNNHFANDTAFTVLDGRHTNIGTDNDKSILSFFGKGIHSKFNGHHYLPPILGDTHNATSPLFFLNTSIISQSFDDKNKTDIDEEDQSLYYPPPYSFVYNNTYDNQVLPGPIVPGIILPPPPNLFAALDDNEKVMKMPLAVFNRMHNMKLHDRLNTSVIVQPIISFKGQSHRNLSDRVKIPIKIKTTNYNIEIEEANVKVLISANNTNRSTAAYNSPLQNTINIRKRAKNRAEINKPSNLLNHFQPNNVKGNTIYYEYFDSRTPAVYSYNNHMSTTPTPVLFENDEYIITSDKKTYEQPLANGKHPSIQSYSRDNKLPGIEYSHYKTIEEFNREIETIRQTLRYYKQSFPLTDSGRQLRTKPIYGSSFISNYADAFSKMFGGINSSTTYYNQDHISKSANLNLQMPNDHNFYKENRMTYKHVPSIRQPNYKVLGQFSDYNPHDNIGITNANPKVRYTPYTTPRPYYIDQPKWYIGKLNEERMPNPLIYNNGASGYNQKIFCEQPSTDSQHQKIGVNLQQQPVNSAGPFRSYISPGKNNMLNDQQLQTPSPYLERDVFINYRYPLPTKNSNSEYLPDNEASPRILIQYNLSDEKSQIHFSAQHDPKHP